MYTILNGFPMYDILKMLETLATDIHSISLKSTDDLTRHFAAIEPAPIYVDRMKVAVTAVTLAGKVTSLRFQRDYESWLAVLPSDQRQNILEFLATRAPAKSLDIPNQLTSNPFVFRTAWRIITASGVNGSSSYFQASQGFLYLRHGGDGEPRDYRYSYTGVGIGKSVSDKSIDFSTKDMPGSGIGWLYRSGSRAADLTANSMAGVGVLVSVSGSIRPLTGPGIAPVSAGGGFSLLMLNVVNPPQGYSDLNQTPQYAGAIGLLWGTTIGLNTSKADAGIAWQTIMVAGPL
jgi:hypothetical protein